MSLGDKIAVLDSGRIEQYDTPRAVYSRPSNSYVGRFVGAANIIAGKISRRSGTALTAETELGQMSAVVAEVHAGKPGDSVERPTRPEAWRLSPTAVGEPNSNTEERR